MPKKKQSEEKKEAKISKTSPFKELALLESEIKAFANKHKATVQNQSKRISDYFEMSCFNYIVAFYELNGYSVKIENLQNGMYKYKCSTAGVQSNFSHFSVSKEVEAYIYEFEIQHNLAVQSAHDEEIFTTPDIVIINTKACQTSTEYYDTKRRFCYVENKDMISFCEVKQFTPFPELLFNFIGTLNELKKEYMTDDGDFLPTPHIAPSLMISGKPNKQTNRIRKSLEERYRVNIIYDLFYSGSIWFTKKHFDYLKTAGRNIRLKKRLMHVSEDDLPF